MLGSPLLTKSSQSATQLDAPSKQSQNSFWSWLPLCLAIVYFFINILVISPLGDFPANDDYVYGLSVKHFLESGELQLYASGSACYLHILTGAFFTTLFGYSFEVLRSINLTLGFASILGIFLVAREVKVDRSLAGFAACLYAVNPLTTNLQFSFMTDIMATTLCCYYLLFFLKGIRSNSFKFYCLAGAMLTGAILARQSNIIFVAANIIAIAWMAYKKISIWPALVATVLAPITVFIAADRFMESSAAMVKAYQYHKDLLKDYLAYVISAPFAFCKYFLIQLSMVSAYLALFCLPLTISIFNPEKAKVSYKSLGLSHLIWFAISAAFLYQVFIVVKRIPYSRNLWNLTEVGASSMICQIHAIDHRIYEPINIACFLSLNALLLVLVTCGQKLIERFGELKENPTVQQSRLNLARTFCFLIMLVAVSFSTINTIIRNYDRYIIDALIPVIICLVIALTVLKVRTLLIPALVIFAFWGFETTRQQQCYMSWNRARWHATSMLEKAGVEKSRIDGGAEYALYNNIDLWNKFEIGDGKHYLPLEHRGRAPANKYRWWPVDGDDYVISFKPLKGYRAIEAVPFKTIGIWHHDKVLILEHESIEKGKLKLPAITKLKGGE